jgi:hypothetical protein
VVSQHWSRCGVPGERRLSNVTTSIEPPTLMRSRHHKHGTRGCLEACRPPWHCVVGLTELVYLALANCLATVSTYYLVAD